MESEVSTFLSFLEFMSARFSCLITSAHLEIGYTAPELYSSLN
jgi:hypothetical protein